MTLVSFPPSALSCTASKVTRLYQRRSTRACIKVSDLTPDMGVTQISLNGIDYSVNGGKVIDENGDEFIDMIVRNGTTIALIKDDVLYSGMIKINSR